MLCELVGKTTYGEQTPSDIRTESYQSKVLGSMRICIVVFIANFMAITMVYMSGMFGSG